MVCHVRTTPPHYPMNMRMAFRKKQAKK
jgi:hypothetical protein